MKKRNKLALLTIFSLIGITRCECSVSRPAEENIDQKRPVKTAGNAPVTYKVPPLQFDFQPDAYDSNRSESDSDDGGVYKEDDLKEWKDCDDIPSAEILRTSRDDHINGQGESNN